MFSGIHGFFRNKLDVDEVLHIVDACALEYGELRFELCDADTMKTRKTKGSSRVRELISADVLFSIAALSAKNERNSVEVRLRGDPGCYLPYDVHVIRETSENEMTRVGRFFDSIVMLSKCDYAFGVLAGDYMEITQELRFIPMSYWCPTNLDANKEYREYLFTLQHMRPSIGQRIPQMYPINYFSHTILPYVETTFRHLIDDSDWDFREIDGIRRIWFTDILNPAKFRTIQEKIREKMWGNPGSSI